MQVHYYVILIFGIIPYSLTFFWIVYSSFREPRRQQSITSTLHSAQGYIIHVMIKTKPLTKLLMRIPLPASIGLYVWGHLFKISGSAKNFGSQGFTGGTLTILVKYALGNLFEIITVDIPPLPCHSNVDLDFRGRDKWGVLAQGHAIFLANLIEARTGNDVDLYDNEANLLQPQPTRFPNIPAPLNAFHLHSIYSLSRGEFYTLIALFLSVVALFVNVFLTFF